MTPGGMRFETAAFDAVALDGLPAGEFVAAVGPLFEHATGFL